MVLSRHLGAGVLLLALSACSSPSVPADAKSDQGKTPVDAEERGGPAEDRARTIKLNTQGVAPIGLTARIRGIELGSDATVLQISASYGGTETNNVPLASEPTYLRDEHGNKLMLKPPLDNPRLDILRGQQLDGQLVFLGAVPPDTKDLTLVINDNGPGDSTLAPGLAIPFSLESAAP